MIKGAFRTNSRLSVELREEAIARSNGLQNKRSSIGIDIDISQTGLQCEKPKMSKFLTFGTTRRALKYRPEAILERKLLQRKRSGQFYSNGDHTQSFHRSFNSPLYHIEKCIRHTLQPSTSRFVQCCYILFYSTFRISNNSRSLNKKIKIHWHWRYHINVSTQTTFNVQLHGKEKPRENFSEIF